MKYFEQTLPLLLWNRFDIGNIAQTADQPGEQPALACKNNDAILIYRIDGENDIKTLTTSLNDITENH